MTNGTEAAHIYFDSEYATRGFEAQRRYPNEELCRFMGRNYFGLSPQARAQTTILEVGCGAGANLWMIAREGFETIGIDLSAPAIALCERMLAKYETSAQLHVASMTELPIADALVDAVVDVFSSHCLDQAQGAAFLKDVHRVLKPGGRFFSYFPSARSDTFTDRNHPDPAFPNRIDDDTLNGLHRATGPFVGNMHPFRFLHPRRYRTLLEEAGFAVTQCETLTRSYQNGAEIFEFVAIEGQKP
ncbi:class I SAM-dependent methyltransferase [Anianabacter salinae]|uniref:class I SAM-dependent methyltransferase n=1 Tax=Anianabacter salinae TaxID=2851023 RepID=UPI00225E0D6F|nr:class I SAM-dependent methyltransferase [Anianabacter salinae]MBV0914174.1 class I SAM-dependent methyltransferase [Anianabacter salinae]